MKDATSAIWKEDTLYTSHRAVFQRAPARISGIHNTQGYALFRCSHQIAEWA
jgi:hypothetical protein